MTVSQAHTQYSNNMLDAFTLGTKASISWVWSNYCCVTGKSIKSMWNSMNGQSGGRLNEQIAHPQCGGAFKLTLLLEAVLRRAWPDAVMQRQSENDILMLLWQSHSPGPWIWLIWMGNLNSKTAVRQDSFFSAKKVLCSTVQPYSVHALRNILSVIFQNRVIRPWMS